jgi:hypothetical protein
VIIFWEEGFPFIDTSEIDHKKLIGYLPLMDSVRSAGVTELRRRLKRSSVDLLINPYGSAFPKAAWDEIYEFLLAGGSLLNLGGSPFSVPVQYDDHGWHVDESTVAYQRQLGIDEVTSTDPAQARWFDAPPGDPLLSGLVDKPDISRIYEMQIRLCNYDGNDPSGVRESILRPLYFGYIAEGRPLAAPIVAVDHICGRFAGGRWVLGNFSSRESMKRDLVYKLAACAAMGCSDFRVRPSFPYYYPEERAALGIHMNYFNRKGAAKSLKLSLLVRKDKMQVVTDEITLEDLRPPYYTVIPLNFPLTPGLYTVSARLSAGDPDLSEKYDSCCTTGFWCYDIPTISLTQSLGVGVDYLMRGDIPTPLVGVAYPSPHSQTGLLCDPNTAEWDADFAAMKSAGVNIVHTVIRSGVRRAMHQPGAISEDAVRAITAFVLTASRHDLPVILGVFSGVPEAWFGENSYQDRRSLHAQKEFFAALSRRLAKFNNVIWEIVDTPLFDTPGSVEGSTSAQSLEAQVSAQSAFSRWVHELKAVIRQNGNKKQPVTVGFCADDTCEAPSPWFQGKEIDFSSLHVDCSQSDAMTAILVHKAPRKPNLVAESSLCGTDIDFAVSCRDLIERKFVTAFSAGATGVIEWMSGNCVSSDRHTASAGFWRGDRTPGPAADVISELIAFFKDARPNMLNRQQEDVCIVIPTASDFASGSSGDSIRTSIRVFQNECAVSVRTASEFSCDDLSNPRLIVLPSVRTLSQPAWEHLISVVKSGAVMLVTGPVDEDDHHAHVNRLGDFGIQAEEESVAEEEESMFYGAQHLLRFGPGVAGCARKAVINGQSGRLKNVEIGDGRLIFAPLPFELSIDVEPIRALYQFALKNAVVPESFTVDACDPDVIIRAQVFKSAVLYGVISTKETDAEFLLTDSLTGRTVPVQIPSGRAIMFILSRKDGRVIAQYGNGIDASQGDAILDA